MIYYSFDIILTLIWSLYHCNTFSSLFYVKVRSCLHNEFFCHKIPHAKKCIPNWKQCNYNNDCDDADDEDGCMETYTNYNTPWNERGTGIGRLWMLQLHKPKCERNSAMSAFTLDFEPSTQQIRYKYTCGVLTQNVCLPEENIAPEDKMPEAKNDPWGNDVLYSEWTDASSEELPIVRDNAKNLAKQSVFCTQYGFLDSFQLKHEIDTVQIHHTVGEYPVYHQQHKIRYRYRCCRLPKKLLKKLHCETKYTPWKLTGRLEVEEVLDSDGGSNVEAIEKLQQLPVKCDDRYFLSSFQLHEQKVKHEDHGSGLTDYSLEHPGHTYQYINTGIIPATYWEHTYQYWQYEYTCCRILG